MFTTITPTETARDTRHGVIPVTEYVVTVHAADGRTVATFHTDNADEADEVAPALLAFVTN